MKPRIRIVSEGDYIQIRDPNSTFLGRSSEIEEEVDEIYDDNEDVRDDDDDGEEEDDEADDKGGEYDYEEEPPVWTFRVLYLGSLSCLFLYILNKFFLYQTAQYIMSMVITVSILYPLGHIMAKLMPKRRVFLRNLGVEFSLNPGPFDIREFALISIFANSGGAYGGITSRSSSSSVVHGNNFDYLQ
ncbi:OLC1v1017171C1 [Oldenlandia corymbosa var. corymbosa]|uniref:OLC1v1017171C1 n=1 Tax=Oldenlandia corymbosa var. corymbosa TaxID=529605 RepID=A0AAV1E8U1_OLDCO|nr:OLC1v1017171C1 [Oldenlandia corymbosa var. corymbosa]